MTSSITPVADSAAAQLAALQGPATAAQGTDPQDRFLTLLVAQLKNQDPLNPMDNAELTSQMAQISTVNGIDKLNNTLQQMAAGFTASQSLQATSMIGHTVLVPGSALQLANGSAQGGAELPQAVDDLVVSIEDASGSLVRKIDLGAQSAGLVGFQWDGASDNGAAAASGRYRFTLSAVQGGKPISVAGLQLGLVSGVTQGAGGAMLDVDGSSAPVALADIKQVM